MATTSIFNGTAPDIVGTSLIGNVLFVQTFDDGTLVTYFDARQQEVGATSFDDVLGNTWTFTTDDVVNDQSFTENIKKANPRRSNIIDYDNDGSDQPVTSLAIIGEGEGDDQFLEYISNTQGVIPLWEDKLTVKDSDDRISLLDQGQLVLALNGPQNQQFTIHLDPNLEPDIEETKPGLQARIKIEHGLTDIDGLYFIGRRRVTLSTEQQEALTCEVAVLVANPYYVYNRTTQLVIDQFESSEILFWSPHELVSGQVTINDYPDWELGQYDGVTLNADGTPTYGFVSTVATTTDPVDSYEWAFEKNALALSGFSALRTQLHDAYDNTHAVNFIRHVDKNGGPLPVEAYYSVWMFFPEAVRHDSGGFLNVMKFLNTVGGNDLDGLTIQAEMINGTNPYMYYHFISDYTGSPVVVDLLPITLTEIKVGEWNHLEVYVLADTSSGVGNIQAWHNSLHIVNETLQTERASTTARKWLIGNHGTKLLPANPTILFDDALIATKAVHPYISF